MKPKPNSALRIWAGRWLRTPDADGGGVVASPIPQEVLELPSIKELIAAGHIVVTVGGGGIPVVMENNEIKGVAAVIDKDYASSLLAREIKADLFLISTAVEKVALNFGKPNEKQIDRMTLSEAKAYLAEGNAFCQRLHGSQDAGHHLVPGSRRQTSPHYQPGEYRTGAEKAKPEPGSCKIKSDL